MDRAWIADLIMRAGLAFAFLYPPINALSDPSAWIGYFPSFMHGFVSDTVLLHSFGAVEVVIALWLLSGWRVFWPASLAFIVLLAIVVFDIQDFQVIFRDLSIAALALTLVVMHAPWGRASTDASVL